MKVKMMGVQRIDFTTDDGELIQGNKLHVLSERLEQDTQMHGYRCASIFTKLPIPKFTPGDIFDLVYEQQLGSNKSRLVAIQPVK